jgi:hypothetical protein
MITKTNMYTTMEELVEAVFSAQSAEADASHYNMRRQEEVYSVGSAPKLHL